MRAFIAIALPEEAKKNFLKLQDILKASAADVTWVEPKNIHLTLKFLGDISDTVSRKIILALPKMTSTQKVFQLRTKALGVFPKPTFARVVWIGVEEARHCLDTLASHIEDATVKLGVPAATKPFSGHITLGRVRSQKNIEKLLRAITNASAIATEYPQQFTVSKITLFQSTLTPQGPIHEEISSAPLG